MKIPLFAVLFAVSGISVGASPAQELEKNLVDGCEARGLQRKDDQAAVRAFCKCSWEVLANNLTVAEYVQMDALSVSRNSPSTLSFWGRIQPKLQSCKDKEPSAVSRR